MNQLNLFAEPQSRNTTIKEGYGQIKTHKKKSKNPKKKPTIQGNLNFLDESYISKNKRQKTQGGTLMKASNPNPKIICLNSRILSKKIAAQTISKPVLSNSTLSILMQEGYLPKTYGRTISWYEILRNRCLADGPKRPHCMLHGNPRVRTNTAQTFITSKEIERSEVLEKLWRDSAYILMENHCKEILDALLMVDAVANSPCLLHRQDIQNLRQGLKELTKYNGHQMAA